MGHRANLLVVDEEGYELYYSHWRASTLDRDLFWGPAHALAFIRKQRSQADGAEWLDEVWAEGGAVMDLRQSHLLWWGGGDLCYDVPRRRTFLELMALVWDGWTVAWAHQGMVDLARYVGVPAREVLTAADEDDVPDLSPPPHRDWVDVVLSIKGATGEVTHFPLAGDIERQLWRCDELVAHAADSSAGHDALDLGEWLDGAFPDGGAVVDAAARQVSVWTARPRPALVERLSSANPTWSIDWQRDRFESQLEATRLRFPAVDAEKAVHAYQSYFLAAEHDRTNYIAEVTQETHAGQQIDINPFALRDDPPDLDEAERRRIWFAAVQRWRSLR